MADESSAPSAPASGETGQPPQADPAASAPASDPGPYEEGKRAGAHPAAVLFGVIGTLWLFMYLSTPSSKDKKLNIPEPPKESALDTPADESPVMFQVKTTLSDLNAVGITVPPQATDSQVVGLLKRLRQARIAGTLGSMIPATSPGNKLGDHAIGEVYIMSSPKFAKPDAIAVLARGAHAPGELYPHAVQFEVAMEEVRGHYRVDLNDTAHPDKASLGFADESGVHSRNYKPLF